MNRVPNARPSVPARIVWSIVSPIAGPMNPIVIVKN